MTTCCPLLCTPSTNAHKFATVKGILVTVTNILTTVTNILTTVTNILTTVTNILTTVTNILTTVTNVLPRDFLGTAVLMKRRRFVQKAAEGIKPPTI